MESDDKRRVSNTEGKVVRRENFCTSERGGLVQSCTGTDYIFAVVGIAATTGKNGHITAADTQSNSFARTRLVYIYSNYNWWHQHNQVKQDEQEFFLNF